MNDHGRATARHTNIELHGTGASPERGFDGHERVLGSARRVSAMSNDLDIAQMAHSSELGPDI